MRPPKLTPAIQEKITALMAGGHFAEVAAKAAGIDPRTYYAWRAKGKKSPGTPYGEFERECEKAEADSELLLVEEVRRKGGWKGALELLKRRFPERWGDRMRAQIGNVPGEEFKTAGPPPPAVSIIIQAGDEWNEKDAPLPDEDKS
jgi:hypothetical protein